MRIVFVSLLAGLALVTPASASQVLQVGRDGRLERRDLPYLPPPAGPELAVPGGEQACPLPKAQPPRGPSATSAVSTAARKRTISKAEPPRYRPSYGAARQALRGLHG